MEISTHAGFLKQNPTIARFVTEIRYSNESEKIKNIEKVEKYLKSRLEEDNKEIEIETQSKKGKVSDMIITDFDYKEPIYEDTGKLKGLEDSVAPEISKIVTECIKQEDN